MKRSNPLGRSRALTAAMVVIFGFAPLALESPGWAQPASAARPASDANRNAAVQYWQAFALLPVMTDAQRQIAATWDTVALDRAALALIQASDQALTQLHRGSACNRCDWGLNKQDSFNMRLPHLVKARELARLACLRARHRLSTGQGAAAMTDVADTLVLARRVGADDVLIGIMVQASIENMAVSALAPHLATLSSDDLAALADRLSRLPEGGSLEGSVVWEREYGLMSLINDLKVVKSDGRPMDEYLAQSLGLPVEAIRGAGGTPESVSEHLNSLHPIYDRFSAALKLPQREAHARLVELRQRAQDNPMKIALPDFTRAYDRYAATQTRVTLLQAAVAILHGGPEKLKKFSDPFSGEPFEYKASGGGRFELLSKVTEDGKTVTLTIGPALK